MAYTPTNWATGDTITASKLNNIESGVQSVSSSYTPTTWATGDIITAVKLNNIEQGIVNAEGGGGGSSDFSTAQVTTVVTGADNHEVEVYANSLFSYEGKPYQSELAMKEGDVNTVNTILYNGTAYLNRPDMYVDGTYVQPAYSFSGNATEGTDEYDNVVITITGDCTCTITIS